MSFVSWQFLILCFLTVVIYFLLGRVAKNYQWVALLAASVVFYLFASVKLFAFLLFSGITTWAFPLAFNKCSGARKKALIAVCLFLNLGILAFFKYAGLFNVTGLAVPLGISFYTFQSIGYSIDVYRQMVEPEKNFFRYFLYVSFFPQISQGPIGKYSELAPQLYASHSFDAGNLKHGLIRMLLGFFKKIVVANSLGNFVAFIYGSPENYSGVVLAFATFMYAIQLYADFSGYMDIACGFSQIIGIGLKENFQTPYFSKSIAEYWRRWHISLGEWFRDYLYYSVMRSALFTKVSKALRKSGHKKAAKNIPVIFGLLATWLLIGMWHGSDWSFIVHGLYHGTFVILAAVFSGFYGKCRSALKINEDAFGWKLFQVIRTFLIVCFGYVLFRASSLPQALTIYSRIFTKNFYFGWSEGLVNRTFDKFYWICMILSIGFLFCIELIERRKRFADWMDERHAAVRWIIIYVMLLAIVFALMLTAGTATNAGNFLYFDF